MFFLLKIPTYIFCLRQERVVQKYLVYECIHDMNHSTKTVKWYPESKNDLKVFLLDGEKAYFLVMDMIDNLKKHS